MKTPFDPRHKKREKAIQDLFSLTFRCDKPKTDLGKQVFKSLPKIDAIIAKDAPEWPIAQINKIDLTPKSLQLYNVWNNKCK